MSGISCCKVSSRSAERNSELFSLPLKGSEGNSESLLLFLFRGKEFRDVFSSAEGFGTEFREILFRGTAGIPSEITICSVNSVFRGIIFLSEIPNPTKNWRLSGIWPEKLWKSIGRRSATICISQVRKYHYYTAWGPRSKLRLSPWKLNLHANWVGEGNGTWVGDPPNKKKLMFLVKVTWHFSSGLKQYFYSTVSLYTDRNILWIA